ncbi:MAG: hypothetical protein ACTSYB_08065 [Candidatus Helarchaeota archaeon]
MTASVSYHNEAIGGSLFQIVSDSCLKQCGYSDIFSTREKYEGDLHQKNL